MWRESTSLFFFFSIHITCALATFQRYMESKFKKLRHLHLSVADLTKN